MGYAIFWGFIVGFSITAILLCLLIPLCLLCKCQTAHRHIKYNQRYLTSSKVQVNMRSASNKDEVGIELTDVTQSRNFNLKLTQINSIQSVLESAVPLKSPSISERNQYQKETNIRKKQLKPFENNSTHHQPTMLDLKLSYDVNKTTEYSCTDIDLCHKLDVNVEHSINGKRSILLDGIVNSPVNNKYSYILDEIKLDDYDSEGNNPTELIYIPESTHTSTVEIDDNDNQSKHNELVQSKSEMIHKYTGEIASGLVAVDSILLDNSIPAMKPKTALPSTVVTYDIVMDSDKAVDISSEKNISISLAKSHITKDLNAKLDNGNFGTECKIYEQIRSNPTNRALAKLCSINATVDGGLFKLSVIKGGMYIPPDALLQSTKIQVIEYDTENIPDFTPASKMYELHPHGQQFKEPVMFKFPLSLKHQYNVNAIRVMYSSKGYIETEEWVELPISSSNGLNNDFSWFIWRGECYLFTWHFCTVQLVVMETEKEKAYPLTSYLFGCYSEKKKRVDLIVTFACDQLDSKDKISRLEKRYGLPLCEQPVLIYEKAGLVLISLEPDNEDEWNIYGNVLIQKVDPNILSSLCENKWPLPLTTFDLHAKDTDTELECKIYVSIKQQQDKYPNQQRLFWHLNAEDLQKDLESDREMKERLLKENESLHNQLLSEERKVNAEKEQNTNTEEALKKEKEEKLNLQKDKENLQSHLLSEKEQNMKLQKIIAESSRASQSEIPVTNNTLAHPEQPSSMITLNGKEENLSNSNETVTLQTMLSEISCNTLKIHGELDGPHTRENKLADNESNEQSCMIEMDLLDQTCHHFKAGLTDDDLIQLQDEDSLNRSVNGQNKHTEGYNDKNEAVTGHGQYHQSPSDIQPVAHSMNELLNGHSDQHVDQPEPESSNQEDPGGIAAKPKTPGNVPQPAHQNVDTVNQMLHYNGLPSPFNTGNAFGRVISPNGKEGASQNILVVNKIVNNIYHNNTPECNAIEDNTWPEGFCRDFRKYLFHVCVAMDKNKPKLHELAKSLCIANTNGFDAKQFVTAWYVQQIDEYENNNNNNKSQEMWFRLLNILKQIEFDDAAAELTVALEKTLVQNCLCDFLDHLKYEDKLFVKLHSKRVINGDQYKRVRAGGSENIQYIIRDVILECNMEGFNHFKFALEETDNNLLLSCITLKKDEPAANRF